MLQNTGSDWSQGNVDTNHVTNPRHRARIQGVAPIHGFAIALRPAFGLGED